MTKFDALITGIGAILAILSYMANGVRKLRLITARFEQFMGEHRILLQSAHHHQADGSINYVKWIDEKKV